MDDLYEILFKILTGTVSVGGGFFAYFKSKSKFTGDLKELRLQNSAENANARLEEEKKRNRIRKYYEIIKYKALEEMQKIKSQCYNSLVVLVAECKNDNIFFVEFEKKTRTDPVEIGLVADLYYDSIRDAEMLAVESSMKLLDFEELSLFSNRDYERAIRDRTDAVLYLFRVKPLKDNGVNPLFVKVAESLLDKTVYSAISRIYEIALRKSENVNKVDIINSHFEQLQETVKPTVVESVSPDYGKGESDSGGLIEN